MNAPKIQKSKITQEVIEEMMNSAASLVKSGGIYFHYKNPDEQYVVMGVCISTDSLEKMVIYVALYGAQAIWVRPLSQWLEKVEINGNKVDRFTFVGQMAEENEEECEEDCDGEDCK